MIVFKMKMAQKRRGVYHTDLLGSL